MKPPKMPWFYKSTYCRENMNVLTCDYLMSSECSKVCAFAKRYHPVERAKYLEHQVQEGFQSNEEFKRTFLRE